MKTLKPIKITTPDGTKIKSENASFEVPFEISTPAKVETKKMEQVSLVRCEHEIKALRNLKIIEANHFALRVVEIDAEIQFWTDIKTAATPLINAKNFTDS